MPLKFIFYSRFFPDTYLTACCILTASPSVLMFFPQISYQFHILVFCVFEVPFPVTWAQTRSPFIPFSFITDPVSREAPISSF